jgi:hypothetical protein
MGYDSAAVGELLDRVAAELDAGRPVASLIEDATFPQQQRRWQWRQFSKPWERSPFGNGGGYDCADVDGVLAKLRRQDDPAARADPWRDLLAWDYCVTSRDADDASLSAPPRRGAAAAPGPARDWPARDYERACADAWRDFGLQPGTQLSLVKTGTGRGELRATGQPALVSARTGYTEFISTVVAYVVQQALDSPPARTFSRDGRAYGLRGVKAAQWPAVAAQISAELPDSPAHLPRTEPASRTGKQTARQDLTARKPGGLYSLADRTGQPVLYTSGQHLRRDPGGVVEFPGQRWLRFPVRGTRRSNAIMTAVDQAGRQVARYRIAAPHALTKWRAIEITVHPEQRLTDELILMLALTAPWISSFFRSPTEGGGG